MPPHRSSRTAGVLAVALLTVSLAACSDDDPASSSGSQSAAATTAVEAKPGGAFTLLSYNVAGLPQEISEVSPKTNIPLISPLLDEFDLVLTQEDFDWWAPDGLAAGLDFTNYHQRLGAATTQEHRSERHPGPEAVGLSAERAPLLGDGLGVLSRFPIAETDRVPWTGCFGGFDTSDGGAADCLAMKGFLFTRVTLADGVEVDVYDVHGEAGGSATDQQLQGDDYTQLAAYIAEHSDGRAVIVAGDTNLHTDNEHPDGAQGADTEIWKTFLGATDLTDGCDATDCDEPGRIDKIAFRSGKGVDLDVTEFAFVPERFKDPAGADLSDHEPLTATFEWNAAT
ncbi:MAG TPA: endonuclease/exonuclease/phosphatase family protein [Microthrixaceae bacterium]|nr:endonuclease/exonuclease/phosphatase family protein [Microthrixaceae bacterium]HNI35822.1 endonuclease/exonuclease/phosphatase family protein [Microthrixaceae bacterium]